MQTNINLILTKYKELKRGKIFVSLYTFIQSLVENQNRTQHFFFKSQKLCMIDYEQNFVLISFQCSKFKYLLIYFYFVGKPIFDRIHELKCQIL